MPIELRVYNRNLSSPTLDMDLTRSYEGLKFSTRLNGGFWTCSFRPKADLEEAWEWFRRKMFYRVIIADGAKTLFEGRIENLGLTQGKVEVGASGYYANLGDIPYSTAYNDDADVVIKAVLTAACTQISSDQTHIEATGGPAIDSAADASYLDIYPNQIVEKLLAFGDDTNNKRWHLAIWENRVPWLAAKSVSSVDWNVSLGDFQRFRLRYKGADLWNSGYAVYDAGGLTRTATANNTISQGKYGDGTNDIIRRKVVPNLGTVVAAAAESARDTWLTEHAEIYPSLEDMQLGPHIYDARGVRWPSYYLRAGQVLRVRDLLPSASEFDSVTQNQVNTFYILETEYDVDRGTMRIVPDNESPRLDKLLARKV